MDKDERLELIRAIHKGEDMMSMGKGDIVTAILNQAKSRGLSIMKGHGSISRPGRETTWTVRNITRLADGSKAPDKTVAYSPVTGWKWSNAVEQDPKSSP